MARGEMSNEHMRKAHLEQEKYWEQHPEEYAQIQKYTFKLWILTALLVIGFAVSLYWKIYVLVPICIVSYIVLMMLPFHFGIRWSGKPNPKKYEDEGKRPPREC